MEMLETSPLPLPLSIHHMNQASSTSSTPYMSAASSPQRSHAHAHAHARPPLDIFFYSAPTSPRSHASHSFFDDLDHDDDYPSEHVPLLSHNSCTAVPFAWELKPGVPRTSDHHHDHQDHQEEMNEEGTRKEEKGEDDFQFDFSGQLDMMVRPSLSSADELFHGGKIRPLKLKPPPSLQINHENKKSSDFFHSPRSPKSAMSKFKDALSMSPKHRRNGSGFGPGQDPFEAAIDEVQNRERGRDRVRPNIGVNTNMNMNRRGGNNNSRKGISRSLSPLRVSEFALLHNQDPRNPTEPGNSITGLFGRGSGNACSKKWRLKDLFLFRSASEGHYKDTQSYSKRWSFRSSSIVSGSGSGSGSGSRSGSGSESGSVSKRKGQGPTQKMIYNRNRTVAEELKKKTTLPYRHGLLACLGFSPVLPQFSYAFPNTPPS